MDVEVARSERRTRFVEARLVAGVLRVSIPAWMTTAEEAAAIEQMVDKFNRKRATEAVDLRARAARLARRYQLPKPASIRWADNQRGRWGSCTASDRSIRISSRLASLPLWVLDYVIIHELAHLVAIDHGPEFRELEMRYPKSERAAGYLMAVGESGALDRRRARTIRQQLVGQAALFE